ncbi:DUF4363 family protein [Desulforamulus ferrireducens]|uniref:DUF4363 family protein n=1 Tax=Desulforamulus ferrireducens TaxID=1833852 RepID=A0A1S6IVT8_9FIRM|nr:DUF4363 family protein [Desulforamulus ferrireducens]AQS58894.1 hypothetical protein B0537_07220 [Desulforamulus ferrireducens]
MRLLLGLFIAMVLAITFGLWVNHALDQAAQELNVNIKQVSEKIHQANWSEAKQAVQQLEEEWQEIASWWPLVLDHQEIDNIEFALAKLKEYVAAEDSMMSQAQLAELKLMILHLPEKEALTIKNIL